MEDLFKFEDQKVVSVLLLSDISSLRSGEGHTAMYTRQ